MNGGWGKGVVNEGLKLFVCEVRGGGWYALREIVFADKGDLNLGGRGWGKRGILPAVAKLNSDGWQDPWQKVSSSFCLKG